MQHALLIGVPVSSMQHALVTGILGKDPRLEQIYLLATFRAGDNFDEKVV